MMTGEPFDLKGAVDLASRSLGATVVAASDESFGDKEHLLGPAKVTFEPGHYGPRGEVVDGWETRRRRSPGHDWAIVRLGLPGRISAIDVDTTSFVGNFPPACALEACGLEGYPGPAELSDAVVDWHELVARSSLHGDCHNSFAVTDAHCFTHVRLSTFPDGGVARLRVYGEALPDPRQVDGLSIDLASQQYGGRVVASSDEFYGSASSLNRPDEARTMGEGWETRRRRDKGHDFVLVHLGYVGTVRQVVVDTRHFRYNASAALELWGHPPGPRPENDSPEWVPLLARTALQPDTLHHFSALEAPPVEWVRLDAFPDGGLSRLRVLGFVDPLARRRAGYQWFNALSAGHARACLQLAGVTPTTVEQVLKSRPLSLDWLRSRSSKFPAEGDAALLARLLEGAR